jgi:tripartite-type tricarboxylate transporter receptor subunit TctC
MKKKTHTLVCLFFGFFVFVILIEGSSVFAQEKFPTKPINLIVPIAVGSGMDMEARGIAPYVQKHLGVTISVENIPGAQTKIGMNKAWKARPDGYTLVIFTMPTPILLEKTVEVDYKTGDFAYVYAWSKNVLGLFVNSETWKTFDEFLNVARKKTLSCGVANLWSVPHLGGLVLSDELGLRVNWVPYDGAGELLTSLAGKHIDFAINMIPSALPLVRAGKIRPLLVLADSHDYYPGVPIPKDMSYKIDVIASIRGIAASPNTSSDRIKILESAFSKAVQDKQYLEWAKRSEIPISPIESRQLTESTIEMYKIVEKYSDLLKGSTDRKSK